MKNIDAFIEEINQLKEADEIVESVFLELGAYGLDKVFSTELSRKIRDYNLFDDSE